MPEGPELDAELDRVRESVEEEREEESKDRRFLRTVSLSTALIAVIAAIASLEAGGTVNEALLLKNAAVGTRTESFDGWAQYQAKGIKAAILTSQKQLLISLGQPPSTLLDADVERYRKEQEEISVEARAKEGEARREQEEAEHLLHQHHRYAQSVTLLQIAVALSAIAALTKNRGMWALSLLAAAVGITFFANGFFLLF